MMRHGPDIRSLATLAFLVVLAGAAPASAQAPEPAGVNFDALLGRLQQIVLRTDVRALLDLQTPDANPEHVLTFAATELAPGATGAVLHERYRAVLAGTPPGYRLVVDAFIEYGSRARVATWRLDVRSVGADWRLADEERVSSTENLYRLSLDAEKQYEAHDLVIQAEDLELRLKSGSVFVSGTDQGVTALVLLGDGTMRFHPRPETEQGQVRIFCGSNVLQTGFHEAFVRINPAEFGSRVDEGRLTERAVDPHDLRRAEEVFREEMPNSFSLDLGSLSRDLWSTLPAYGDLLAEVQTGRYGTLTYARSGMEPEDITLFDRRHHHNIALYASKATLAARGPFYDEDDYTDYRVTDYDVDVTFSPEARWLRGRATLRLEVRAASLSTITLRLADSLQVQSIAATGVGLLLPIRIRNQNSVVVSLPTALPHGAETLVTVVYAGRLQPQTSDLETAPHRKSTDGSQRSPDEPEIEAEPSFLYSNRSYWYPQGKVTGYATARLRITIPAMYDCVASGELADGSPSPTEPVSDPAHPQKTYVFTATQPVRYLAFIVSRFVRGRAVTVALPASSHAADAGLPPMTAASYQSIRLAVAANPRQVVAGRQLLERAGDIASYYASILGDAPYPSFTIAAIDNDVPGGHSPPYFAILDEPLPTTHRVWREDPTAVPDFPEFFIAHELAHQWWGQGVGWRNYHEQWLSEGFAQYFAALYAQRERGHEVFAAVMRQFRRWAMEDSSQGPVYLGYRLGHIRNDQRIFRAVVYDKGAAVLDMLRELVGDAAFYRGLRRFYQTCRFRKAGTEDLRIAMELESGRHLSRFFERWIYGSSLPRLRFSYHLESGAVILHFEQLGQVFDVPVTVTLEYADQPPADVIVPVTDAEVDFRVPLAGKLRAAEIGRDDAALAAFVKGS